MSEQLHESGEKGVEVKVPIERYEELEQGAELSAEHVESNEKQAEKAREEVERAVEKKNDAEKQAEKPTSRAARQRGTISKKEKTASYKRRMKQVQAELPAGQRAFSKVIHNPVVEKSSEFIGATVARPNAILAGAVVAFILVLAVYLIAKNLGYVLSGFETIAAFAIGWILGILYDYFRVMITGKKS